MFERPASCLLLSTVFQNRSRVDSYESTYEISVDHPVNPSWHARPLPQYVVPGRPSVSPRHYFLLPAAPRQNRILQPSNDHPVNPSWHSRPLPPGPPACPPPLFQPHLTVAIAIGVFDYSSTYFHSGVRSNILIMHYNAIVAIQLNIAWRVA